MTVVPGVFLDHVDEHPAQREFLVGAQVASGSVRVVLGRSLARRVALRSPSGEIARDIGAVDGGGSSRLTVIPAIPPVGGLLGNGIVDSDVDPDVRKAGIAAQGADSPFLGSAVDRVKFLRTGW